ncbi:uncharacterized protein LAJ45_03349 [Morchella importuna]|uniref:uncharacterized protein n=1 Tax=Morchella importuna TaxID=1174673 RepID=UPI001E8E45F7|nr:uncharacterized protein LAJ45_03349 [Morchella importuna]KAH8152509.1 hypothetical protein LAJ45_03349 [Morchella importuna]
MLEVVAEVWKRHIGLSIDNRVEKPITLPTIPDLGESLARPSTSTGTILIAVMQYHSDKPSSTCNIGDLLLTRQSRALVECILDLVPLQYGILAVPENKIDAFLGFSGFTCVCSWSTSVKYCSPRNFPYLLSRGQVIRSVASVWMFVPDTSAPGIFCNETVGLCRASERACGTSRDIQSQIMVHVSAPGLVP